MTSESREPRAAQPQLTLIGEQDDDLHAQLLRGLMAFNDIHTGNAERKAFSVRVTDADGELVGGITAGTWGSLCSIGLLWVREDSRKDGWGTQLLQAAAAEAIRRGCEYITVSSFTFQAPLFYQRYGFVETGRTPGVPGGHEDVQMYKRLTPEADVPRP